MHSRLFQLSRKPISKEDYTTEHDYYDNFVGRNADYVVASNDEERYNDIEWLKSETKYSLSFNGDSFTIKNKAWYFNNKYLSFLESLDKLTEITLEQFSNGDRTLGYNMYLLKEAYDDAHGFYVDLDDDGLITFDDFVRYAKEGETYYIGATFDYHF